MKKIGISTDCMCDLPANYLRANGVDVMQFYIYTATGRFWNESEITADNIVEYLDSGNVFLRSSVPEPEECRAYFESILAKYDQVIHITASDKIGMSHPNAAAALELMGEDARRVTLVNSGGISTGLGHMVLLAVKLRDSGNSVSEIVAACDGIRDKISNSFIIPNADYLYRMGYASQTLRALCSVFHIHPVLSTKKGRLCVKSIRIGNYERAVTRYIRKEFRHSRRIDRSQLFITHAGCPINILNQIKTTAETLCNFDRVTVTKASAVLSSFCGPESVGVLFVYQ